VPSWIVFELVLTKLPHYVLPLYPAIAILTVGALERRVLSRSWLRRGAAWWFVIPALTSVIAVVGAVTLTRQPVFLAWPFVTAALIFGLFAWWLYDDNRAERSLLNAVVAAIFLAVAILLLISAAAWYGRQSRPYGLIGWLWFLGTLVPVIGLVQVGGQTMADRYTYIPSIGIFLGLVFLAAEFAERLQTPAVIRFGLGGLIAYACIVVTEHQLAFWRDSEALFRRADAVTKNNDLALLNLGVALNTQGRYEEALATYRRAEAFGSQHYEIYNNLGNVLRILGRPAESLAEYRKAIQLNPGNAALHLAAGNQLAALHRYDNILPVV